MNLTIAYITARERPCFKWFVDSLRLQLRKDDAISVTVVDALATNGRTEEKLWLSELGVPWVWTAPKPNIWQGEHRVTKQDWWAVSASTNTAMCLCKSQWICCVDDRSILLPGWLDRIRIAIKSGYAVCGSYEKVHDLIADNGIVQSFTVPLDDKGKPNGKDGRLAKYNEEAGLYGTKGPVICPGEWYFGCNFAMPVEWTVAINGLPEIADGMGFQDSLFGLILKNNGYPICYDPHMKILEDRTPGQLSPAMRREDKGVSPNDKSHALLAMLSGSKHSMNDYDFMALRESILAGGAFPIPEKKEYRDWYDGSLINGL